MENPLIGWLGEIRALETSKKLSLGKYIISEYFCRTINQPEVRLEYLKHQLGVELDFPFFLKG